MSLFLSSILITGVGTSLITVRILSATRGNPAIGSLAPYRRIQRIIIESGVIYLTGMLIVGVPLFTARKFSGPGPQFQLFFSGSGGSNKPWVMAPYHVMVTYGEALLTPLAGIAPTLIALRVVTQTSQTEAEASQPGSRLTFRRTIRRNHAPAFDGLVSSLHLESTWEDEDVTNGTSGVADCEEGGNVVGEQIQLQDA
ncbi:hypothetical protein D9619_013475 [Psilocybe cf. subviscida]|uniref:Uncharacterized protein n=1 Tax=Psilocybe cf. subviscida TaxID=2480587 RepID=A0A8H5BJG1_9AGAR|nr:hypothetical protein D9619_013475 [Psilocybe cf. subviscida]